MQRKPVSPSPMCTGLTSLQALPCTSPAKHWILRECKGLIILWDKSLPSSRVLPPGPRTSLSPHTWKGMQRQLLTPTKASAALDFRMVASLLPVSPRPPHSSLLYHLPFILVTQTNSPMPSVMSVHTCPMYADPPPHTVPHTPTLVQDPLEHRSIWS